MKDVIKCIKLKCSVKVKFMIDTDYHIFIFAGAFEPEVIFSEDLVWLLMPLPSSLCLFAQFQS